MKSKLILALSVLALNSASAAEEPTPGVLHFDHAKVAALFEKGGPLLATNNFKIQAGRRTGPGEVKSMPATRTFFTFLKAQPLSSQAEPRLRKEIPGKAKRGR